MPAESKKLDTKCLEPFGGKSGGWVLLQLIVGDYYYQNQVKSLDDKRRNVFESKACLILPLEMFQEYIGKEFKFVVEIEDLKPREEDDQKPAESKDEKGTEEK